MTKRTKIIVIAGIVLAIIVLIALILWLFFKPKVQPVTPENPAEINVPVTLPQSSTVATPTTADASQNNVESSLKSLAMTFAERYGSYSSQGNYSNLKDSISLMTLKLKTATDNYLAAQKISAEQTYYGMTTIAVSAKILSLNESSGQASIQVTTQRQENKGSTVNPRVTYQNLNLELAQTDDGWKVDEAAWQ